MGKKRKGKSDDGIGYHVSNEKAESHPLENDKRHRNEIMDPSVCSGVRRSSARTHVHLTRERERDPQPGGDRPTEVLEKEM